MSKRYGKPPKGRRNQPGYGSNRRCEACGKPLRNHQENEIQWADQTPINTGKMVMVRRCFNPQCSKYINKPIETPVNTESSTTFTQPQGFDDKNTILCDNSKEVK